MHPQLAAGGEIGGKRDVCGGLGLCLPETSGGNDEGVELVAFHIDAHKAGAFRVFANGREGFPKWRVHHAPQEINTAERDDQHELVIIGERWVLDPGGHRNANQAIIAASETVPFEGGVIDDHRERQGEHGEIGVRQAYTKIANNQGCQGAR